MGKEVKKEISESQVKDICFIITPIGEDGSAIRKKTDGLIDNVLDPVCNELGLRAVPAHNIDKIGSITNQVVQHVLESKMVIANLTGLNPNVMYELAIRHASKKPVVCIAENGTKLPFDITTERTIFYSDDMYGATRLRYDLKDKLQSALSDSNIDNPIYRAVKENSIIKKIQSLPQNEKSDSLLYILQRLERIENAISKNRNIEVEVKDDNCNFKFGDDDLTRQYEFVYVFSNICPTNVQSELINYLEAYAGHGDLVDYKISNKEMTLLTRSKDMKDYMRELNNILSSYNIRVKSISKRNVRIPKI